MDLKSLEKRIKKISDYAGINNKGKMFSELGSGMPYHKATDPCSENGILIYSRNSPEVDTPVNIRLSWWENKYGNINLQKFFEDFNSFIKGSGDHSCTFCELKCKKYYKIKTGFFSSKNVSICVLCTRLIREHYSPHFINDYDKVEDFSKEFPSGLFKSQNTNLDIQYCEVNGRDEFGNSQWWIIDRGYENTATLKSDLLNDNLKKIIYEKREKAFNYIEKITTAIEKAIPIARKRAETAINKLKEEDKKLRESIINLLKEKAAKMPASDIDAHLKYQNVDEIKAYCESMYLSGEISRTANYRYFILTEDKKQSKKTSEPKSEKVDVKAELKKYKEMLEDGLITQEAYDAKMNQLLGL